MKISALTYFAAALSASVALAEQPQPEPTPTVPAADGLPTLAPEAALKEYLEHGNNLELRQVGAGNLNGEVTTAATQAGATTTWYMASAIGTTDTWVAFTYTQTFAAVPDQWPSPIAGQIGFENGSPLVLEMQDVVVTIPVVAAMVVEEVVEVPPGYGENSPITNHTTPTLNQTSIAANMTAAVNITSTRTARIFPSQMDPEWAHTRFTMTP